jgi:cytochrome c
MKSPWTTLALTALLALAASPRLAHAADQAADGAKLFGANCAKCHGDAGQGTKQAPALVGKTALPLDPPANAKFRKTQFKTALDVFKFVKENMPPKKGGSLTDAEYAAILAFDLKANGVDLAGKTLDAKLAETIVLH